MQKSGILSGIRVIDCGTYIAGPASATVMSDFGAEVFKIERPDGGDLVAPLSASARQSQVGTELQLDTHRTEQKKRRARSSRLPRVTRLSCGWSKPPTFFVTNYQAQLLTKFHLTWDELRAINERLIFAHLTGYGDKGDDADLPAFDALAYWARSGLMTSVTGRDGTPSRAAAGNRQSSDCDGDVRRNACRTVQSRAYWTRVESRHLADCERGVGA